MSLGCGSVLESKACEVGVGLLVSGMAIAMFRWLSDGGTSLGKAIKCLVILVHS
jgi:hypothetical protein